VATEQPPSSAEAGPGPKSTEQLSAAQGIPLSVWTGVIVSALARLVPKKPSGGSE
jgi:hypothetical protein